jgi:hypothetical protein
MICLKLRDNWHFVEMDYPPQKAVRKNRLLRGGWDIEGCVGGLGVGGGGWLVRLR